MQINVQANDIELTDPLREYIDKRIGSLDRYLKRFDQDLIRAEVEVARTTKHHRQGEIYYAEVNLSLPGRLLRATHKAEDIRVAVDRVRELLKREIRKYKDQLNP